MSSQQKKKTENNKFQKSYFDVLGLCCPSEVPLIENILNSLDGVKEFSVIVPSRTVIVVHDALLISQLQIVKALNQARLEANVRAYGEKSYKKKWPSPWAVASGMLLAVSFLKYVYGPFRWLALGAVAAGLFPILSRAFASIRNFRLDINILVLIAVIGTIAMNDYTEAGTIVFLFTIAEWLESRASHKASAVMSSLMSLAPQKAVLSETGEEVDADEVKLNTILAVKAGEVIPIDGVVVDGKCEVDEKTLTGESFPVPKEKDSTVWAGTINLNGYISLKTAALAEDCVVAKMTKLVEEAQNSKSKTQRFIDKCSQYYTPAVVIISACLAVIPAALRVRDLNHWFHLALVVLVSACPCGLILSTPVATFCALTKAATSGLLIKGGDYLEILAKIKVTAFDKTGTITMGEFVVTDFQSLHEDFSVNTLLYWVSSIESKSSHPLAAALVNYAKALLVKPKPESVEDYQNFPGEGLHGKIDGNNVYIGNRKIALRAGCGTVSTMEGDAKGGKTIGYIFCGPKPAGIFSLSDACRTGVAEAIKELKSLGIRAAMLTGDNDAAAMHAQEQLGNALEVVHAELLPEDKARIINEFKKEGPTAMVGDGLNDAPALATADIGISMGISGSALATETGHVILMSNDIRKIPKAIRLARKAHRKIIENVTLSIATKVAILALAFAGHPFVWAAVLADVGTCLLVILNSMLLLGGTHKHGGKCCKSSAASNTKKHGCSAGHSHTSHENQNCCSGKNLQKACEPHKPSDQCCASKFQPNPCGPNSCGNKKCTDSFAKRHGCAGTDGCNEVKYYEYGNCIMDHKTKAHNTHNHDCSGTHSLSSCTEDKCSTAIERKGSGVSDALNGAEDCHHGRDTVTVDGPSQHLHCHADLEEGLEVKTNGGCNSDCCCDNNIESHVNNGAMRNMSGKCCGQQHPRDTEACPHKQKCGAGCSDVSHGGTDPMGTEHVAKHVCMSLKTREIGGCCRSYVKECCKHGHLGAGFGGGLTEIVTE